MIVMVKWYLSAYKGTKRAEKGISGYCGILNRDTAHITLLNRVRGRSGRDIDNALEYGTPWLLIHFEKVYNLSRKKVLINSFIKSFFCLDDLYTFSKYIHNGYKNFL